MTILRPTLPGPSYTDPSTFDSERERIFEANWFCAVASTDIGKAGAFRTVTVGRESVLITRSRTGEARAFLNVCRHRGAMLCTEPAGEVRRTFRCPYHAWSYDLDGGLRRRPLAEDCYAGIDASELGLRELPPTRRAAWCSLVSTRAARSTPRRGWASSAPSWRRSSSRTTTTSRRGRSDGRSTGRW